jgi:RNA polymerase sigma-70 factor, ECF subfamily
MSDPSPSSSAVAPRGAVLPSPSLPDFRQLYATHFAFTWRSLRYLGVPSQQLDDAVQEVWVVVHRRLGEFQGRSALETWLFGIALNVQRNLYRSERRRSAQVPLSEELCSTSPDPLLEREGRETWLLVMRFLQTLDDERRAVFVASLLEGLPQGEAAEACGLDVPTVYLRVRSLRRAFRSWASAQRGDP